MENGVSSLCAQRTCLCPLYIISLYQAIYTLESTILLCGMEEKPMTVRKVLYPEQLLLGVPRCRELGVKKEPKDNQFELYSDRSNSSQGPLFPSSKHSR